LHLFLKNPRFSGIHFPDDGQPETLEQRYNHRMSEPQLDVIEGVLAMDPRQRLTAKGVMELPWFEGVRLPRSSQPPKLLSRSPAVPIHPTISESDGQVQLHAGHVPALFADASPAAWGEEAPSLAAAWQQKPLPEGGGALFPHLLCPQPPQSDPAEPPRKEEPQHLAPVGGLVVQPAPRAPSRRPTQDAFAHPLRLPLCEEPHEEPPCEAPGLAALGLEDMSPTLPEHPRATMAQEVMTFKAGSLALGQTLIVFGRQVGDRDTCRDKREGDVGGVCDELRDTGLPRGERRRKAGRRSTVDGTRLHRIPGGGGRPTWCGAGHQGRMEDCLPAILTSRDHPCANPGAFTPREKGAPPHLPTRPPQTSFARTMLLQGAPELPTGVLRELSRRGRRMSQE
jgi:hypothetical protein